MKYKIVAVMMMSNKYEYLLKFRRLGMWWCVKHWIQGSGLGGDYGGNYIKTYFSSIESAEYHAKNHLGKKEEKIPNRKVVKRGTT